MDYNIALEIECVLKNEYIDNFYLLKEYFFNVNKYNEEDEDIVKIYNNIPENLRQYADKWKSLKIWNHFNYCNLNESILKIRISKNALIHEGKSSTKYIGKLEDDYAAFTKYIISQMCHMITKYEVSHDDREIFYPTIFTDEEFTPLKI